jgi:hypothetical protein
MERVLVEQIVPWNLYNRVRYDSDEIIRFLTFYDDRKKQDA